MEEKTVKQKGGMKKILQYAKKYWWAFLLAPIFMVLEVLMDLRLPKLMSQIVDVGIKNGDIEFIKTIGLQMIMYSFIGLLAGVSCGVFATLASRNFGADLRHGVYLHTQTFSFKNHDYFKTGSLITRLTNDIVQIQNTANRLMRMMVRSPMLLFGSLIYIFTINRKLSIVILIALPFVTLLIFLAFKYVFPLFKKLQKQIDKVNTVMQENLAGIRVIKAFVRSDFEKKRFGNSNEELKNTAIHAYSLMAIFNPLITLILNLCICIALYLGGTSTIAGNIEMGEFMAYLQYLSRLLMAITMFAMGIIHTIRAVASKDRIVEVLSINPDINNNLAVKENTINAADVEFDNVSFSYLEGEGDEVLKNISFKAKAGQKIAILGATGSGKTTLVNLIPRLYDVNEGQIKIDNVPVQEYDLSYLRKNIGVCLQQAILFSGTVADNIAYGNEDADREEIIAAAKAAQADEFISKMDKGYDYWVEQKGNNLSGGQKQRISIARALLINPKILILDDSTSAVDIETEGKIQDSLKERLKDCTSFVVAQRISTVIDADTILVLEDGKIAAQGSHKELLKNSDIYKEIYYSQLGEEEVYNEEK